jgi:hypothetical protein
LVISNNFVLEWGHFNTWNSSVWNDIRTVTVPLAVDPIMVTYTPILDVGYWGDDQIANYRKYHLVGSLDTDGFDGSVFCVVKALGGDYIALGVY